MTKIGGGIQTIVEDWKSESNLSGASVPPSFFLEVKARGKEEGVEVRSKPQHTPMHAMLMFVDVINLHLMNHSYFWPR